VGRVRAEDVPATEPITDVVIRQEYAGLGPSIVIESPEGEPLFRMKGRLVVIGRRQYSLCDPTGRELLLVRQCRPLCSSTFDICERGTVVGQAGLPFWRARGFLELDGLPRWTLPVGYGFRGHFELQGEGAVVARAVQRRWRIGWSVSILTEVCSPRLLAGLAVIYVCYMRRG